MLSERCDGARWYDWCGRIRPSINFLVPQPTCPLQRGKLSQAFRVIEEVATEADQCLPLAKIDADAGRVIAAMFVRGINCVKSVQAQLEQAHWETAAGTCRQLFELLINAECLVSSEDVEAAAFRYAKFGLLQMVLHQHAAALYDERRGRPVDADRLAVLEGLLSGAAFEEFSDRKTRDGWAPTWSGQSAWALATLSSNALRRDQYNLMFWSWSEQAHATPGALLPGIFARGGAGWEKAVVAEDDTRVLEAIAMTVTFFLELWQVLPPFAPLLDAGRALAWTTQLADMGSRKNRPADPGGSHA